MSETATIPVPETAALAPALPTALLALPALAGSNPAQCMADPYIGIAVSPFPPESAEILMAPIQDEEIEVLPTNGELYMPEMFYRRRLNRAFGPGAWAMRPLSSWSMTEREIEPGKAKVILVQRWGLYIHGRFVSEALGTGEYWRSNDNSSEADAAESAKSIALRRCCKDIGPASELWMPRFANRWRDEHCVRVWVSGGKKPCWRRKDAKAFWNETGIVQDKETKSVVPATSGVPATIDVKRTPTTPEKASAPTAERCPGCGKTDTIGTNRYDYSDGSIHYEGGRACWKKKGGCGRQWGGTAIEQEPPPEPEACEPDPGDDLPF